VNSEKLKVNSNFSLFTIHYFLLAFCENVAHEILPQPSMNSDFPENANVDILIVDDTPDNLYILARMLSKRGYKVRKALDGSMALTACKTLVPDLILLDIMMPEMDGFEVCQQLKANPETRDIPVIFLSALVDALDKVKAFKMGGVDYITKPFQLEEVLIRVQHQLLLRQAKDKIQQLNAELESRVRARTEQLELANQELKNEIERRQELQNELLHLALHDSLTNLPNRALFMESLQEAIAQLEREETHQFAVLFLDCDRFKVVNDSLGHSVGDELLKAISKRLHNCLKREDLLARLGGDEFAILLRRIADEAEAIAVAERILASLSTPFQLSRHEVFINASIGIALSNVYDDSPEYLLQDADTAMYRAKALGRSRYHVFDPSMHQSILRRLELENDLRRAIEREELKVFYQPIVDLSSGRIVAFEALVRWFHRKRGFVSPAEFIPVAEESGTIHAIDLWVLQSACRQLQQWQKVGAIDSNLSVGINLSAITFLRPHLTEEIRRIVTDLDFDPERLKLEITETAILENKDLAQAKIGELQQCGIKISLDDFGTGYSSLSYLHELPVNTLKIDQSFIRRMNGNPQNRDLIPAIITMAHTMEMEAIAEGIETQGQLNQLRKLACNCGQGYLFSAPLDAPSTRDLLASQPRW
jgi:diguanylate cyclase (GGDEF)-like protein